MSAALLTFEKLLSLSEAMLMTATAEDWATLAKQQREREGLSATIPDNWLQTLSIAEQTQARRLLQNCLRLDAAIGPCVESRLDELRVLLRI